MKTQTFLTRCMAIAVLLAVMLCSFLYPVSAASEKDSYVNSLVSAGFPKAYAEKLYTVHQSHPNWKFTAVKTGLNWSDALSAETGNNLNLVPLRKSADLTATRLYRDKSVGTYTSNGGFTYSVVDGSNANQTGWIRATPMAVSYFMNPYTFLGNDITMMQFESLEWNFDSYDEAVKVVTSMLAKTFMASTSTSLSKNYVTSDGKIKYTDTSGNTQTINKTYAEVICTAAKNNNVNPCFLVSKILGEHGTTGSSSVTGTYSSYTGYYNYFNIGAVDDSNGQAVAHGLKYAKSYGWTTPEKSINGGTEIIAKYYIARGQNTSYLQKFNMTSNNTYNHQYMSAVNGVVNTTYSTYKAYRDAGVLDQSKTFYIPIFNNLPETSGTAIQFTGYQGSGSGVATATVNLRDEPSVSGGNQAGSITTGETITVEGGFRDTRVAYTGSVDATNYRMYSPLWYKVTTSNGATGYVVEESVDVSALAKVSKGRTFKLKYSVSGNETPYFFSQDTRIATVSSAGVVTGVGDGTTNVVAYLSNGAFDVLKVTVGDGDTEEEASTDTKTESSTESTTDTDSESTTEAESSTESTTETPSEDPVTPEKTYPDYSSEDIRLVKDSNGDFYCYRNGEFVKYTGIAKGDSGAWWYCEDGALRTKTILAKNQNGWYYCEKGKVTFQYNGLATNQNGTYYLKNSKVQFSYNGTYTKDGTTYTIKDGKVVSSTKSSTASCPYREPSYVVNRSKYEYGKIRKGNEGVKWVQWWLTKKGYYNDKIDGFFGPGTQSAVKKFQKANGLDADGSVGPITRKALKS